MCLECECTSGQMLGSERQNTLLMVVNCELIIMLNAALLPTTTVSRHNNHAAAAATLAFFATRTLMTARTKYTSSARVMIFSAFDEYYPNPMLLHRHTFRSVELSAIFCLCVDSKSHVVQGREKKIVKDRQHQQQQHHLCRCNMLMMCSERKSSISSHTATAAAYLELLFVHAVGNGSPNQVPVHDADEWTGAHIQERNHFRV